MASPGPGRGVARPRLEGPLPGPTRLSPGSPFADSLPGRGLDGPDHWPARRLRAGRQGRLADRGIQVCVFSSTGKPPLRRGLRMPSTAAFVLLPYVASVGQLPRLAALVYVDLAGGGETPVAVTYDESALERGAATASPPSAGHLEGRGKSARAKGRGSRSLSLTTTPRAPARK